MTEEPATEKRIDLDFDLVAILEANAAAVLVKTAARFSVHPEHVYSGYEVASVLLDAAQRLAEHQATPEGDDG